MVFLLFLLFLSINSLDEPKLAGEAYLYEYYKLDKEMAEANEMQNSDYFAQYLPLIQEKREELRNCYVQISDMKVERRDVRRFGDARLEVSLTFLRQMLNSLRNFEDHFEQIAEIKSSTYNLVEIIRGNVGPVEVDLEGEFKKISVSLHFIRSELSFLQNTYNLMHKYLDEFLVVQKRIKYLVNREKVYKAFSHYLAEIEDQESLEKAQIELNSINTEQHKLLEEQEQIETTIDVSTFQAEGHARLIKICSSNLLNDLVKLFYKPFSVLLGKNWESSIEYIDTDIKRKTEGINLFESRFILFREEITKIKKYKVDLKEDFLKELSRKREVAAEILRKMTTQSGLRRPDCRSISFNQFKAVIDLHFKKLPVKWFDWVMDVWNVFTLLNDNLNFYCEAIYYLSHFAAHSLTRRLHLAFLFKLGEFADLYYEKRESLWHTLVNDTEDLKLKEYWHLRKEIQDRGARILALEDEKEFGVTTLNIFTFMVMLASMGAATMAMGQRIKTEEEQKTEEDSELSFY